MGQEGTNQNGVSGKQDGSTNTYQALRQSLMPFLAGSLAGVVTKTSTAPLERVKTMLQVEGMALQRKLLTETGGNAGVLKPSSILQVMRSIFAADGLRGFWYGNGANCLRVVPVYALKFGFNDSIKSWVRTTPDEKLSFGQLVASGTLAGSIQMFTTYPLEVVRTRLTVGKAYGASYNGIFHCFSSTLKHEGIRGLYKGLSPTILTGSPYVGLQMSCFEMVRRKAEELGILHDMKTAQSVVCGALAGIIAQTITYPGDTVRKRMQTDGIRGTEKMYRGMWHCTMSVFKTEGPSAFFAGLAANVIRGIPGAGIQFAAYNFFKDLLLSD